jgi:2-polyprenyl-6-methoxyphenol hydroxylase-like FAD-dependent oxidoreductase
MFADELPGTAQTLNDAAALGTQLSYSIGVEEVPARLAAWETPRQDRVKTIQRGERPWLG